MKDFNISEEAAAEKKDKIFANDTEISDNFKRILGKAESKLHSLQQFREPEKYLIEAFEKLKHLLKDENEFENNPNNINFNSDMLKILSDQSQIKKNIKLANYIRKIGDELKNILE
jgi:hypothetical protein